MAGPFPLGPWPGGVNNRAPEHALPTNEDGQVVALRQGVNVDLDDAGWPRLRQGRVQRVTATRAHSLFAADHALLANVDGDLIAYARAPDGSLAAQATVRADIGPRYVTAAQVGEDVYWSNELELRRMDADFGDHAGAIPTPRSPTIAAASSGGLVAGEYLVSLTWKAADGRESGACNPIAIDITEGQGILLTNLPLSADGAATLQVWLSPANPDPDTIVLYHVRDLPAGTAGYSIGAHHPGRALETLWHLPLPPGQIVRPWNGRLLVAAGNLLCWSPALRVGLMHQDSALRFGERLTLLEPAGEGISSPGIFVADHKRTYFLGGDRPEAWQKRIVYPHPAVPGVSTIAPGTAFGLETAEPMVCWLASNGVFCLGAPSGVVTPLTERRVALPVGAERGAATFREFDGLRQVLATFIGGAGNTAGVTDSTVATVRRHGVTVD